MINEILNKYLNNERNTTFTDYSLDNIIILLELLGEPHKNFRSVHIAGTNGKGSVAFMIAGILEKSGYKTGLYISPHLIKITERIKINSEDIDESILYKYLNKIDSVIQNKCSIIPTYFDILTAAAFEYFSEEAVDIAIIETGLGGRLDSTNVIIPEISIITDISFDHTHILGNTLERITEEKCGIIKYRKPVITSNTEPSVVTVIEKNTLKNQSILYRYDRDYYTENIVFKNGIFSFDFLFDKYRFPEIRISLFPVHQVKNAATVLTAISILRSKGFARISNEIIYTVFAKIIVPGRFEILCEEPLIIYDPAHNFNALNDLIDGMKSLYHNKKIYYIISMMADKAEEKTLNLFHSMNGVVIYYTLNDLRAYVPDRRRFNNIVSDPDNVIELLTETCNDDSIILFTGTFRIYETALKITRMLKK